MARRVISIVALLSLAMGGCQEKKGTDQWETGKYVPPPKTTPKLKPLPRFDCKVIGSLKKWRYNPVVSVLPDGKVLVSGGRAKKAWLSTTEIVDPASGKVTRGGVMRQTRAMHTTVTLTDGRVLVVGGGSTALEVFDPKTRTWSGAGTLKKEAVGVAAAQLPGGKVYIAGGDLTGRRELCRDAYLWSPKGGLTNLPRLKKGIKGQGFAAAEGKVVLLARLTSGDRPELLITDPKKGNVDPFESKEILWKALRELGRSKGEQVSLAHSGDGKPVLPPTGLRGQALLRFFPSRMSWRTLAKLNRDHSGGAAVALSPDKILVVGGRDQTAAVELCSMP